MHPAFVWERVDEYPKLDKRTVTVDTAISRLRTIAVVEISEEDEQILKSLRTTRNAIEHYEWSTTETGLSRGMLKREERRCSP